MRRSGFPEEQIIGVPKEHGAGLSAAELCRKYGVNVATLYKWRTKYGDMEVSDAWKLKALEDENRRLKKLLAKAMLDVAALRELLEKTSDAQLAEECRGLGDWGEGLLVAPCLRTYQHGSENVSLCVQAARR